MRIAAINELAIRINRKLSLDDILQIVREQARWLLDFVHLSVQIREEHETRFVVLFGPEGYFQSDDPMIEKANRTSAPVVENAEPSPGLSRLVVPLHADDAPFGTLNFALIGHPYTLDDVRIAHLLALQISGALHNARIFEKQRELIAYRARMMQIVSHDLKSPLSVLRGYVELLSDASVDAEQQDYLSIMREVIIQLNTMTTELLDLERTQQHRPAMKPVEIAPLLEEVAASLQPLAVANNQSLVVNLSGQPACILAERMQLRAAISNLVNNAIKYTPDGGNIALTVVQVDNQIAISVIDNGIGIPFSAQKELFQPFYRVHAQGMEHVTGTGLGLSLVKAVVEAHGGHVSVYSDGKSGSCFTITLPVTGHFPDQDSSGAVSPV